MNIGFRRLFAALILVSTSSALLAQGAHYWTRNYGARSTLLSNSVIGSVNDLGAVFYNPGRMGLIQDPTFILSADVYEYSKVQFKDIPGGRVSLSSSDIGSVPGFIAGTFRIKSLEGHTFAYSILTRQRNDANIRYREELTPNTFPGVPGIEAVSTGSTLNEKLRQQWYSLSWAYSPAENWGVGATLAGVRYKSEKLTGVDLRVLTENNRSANYQYDRFYSFSQYGFLLKAGIAKRNSKVNWGVTFTTPMLGLFGGGDVDYAEIYNSLEADDDNYFATFQQDDLDVNYKMPWAIGAGVSFRVPKWEIYLSAEWFSAVPKYEIMTTDEFIGQSNGDTLTISIIDNLKSVMNVGVGGHYQASERLGVYLSASTDFSAVDETPTTFVNQIEVSNSTFTTNLYHVASGVVFEIANSDITLGLTYTGATQPIERVIGLPPDDGDDPVIDPENPAKYRWTRLQVVVGFSLSFIQG